MKVIGLTNNDKSNSASTIPGVYLMADSSLLKDGKSFFVPDFSSEISFRPSLVIRVNRLGKNISQKFAHRYYDAITLGLALKAEDIANRLNETGQPADLATGFDGAAIIGDFIPLEQVNKPFNYSISIDNKNLFIGSDENLRLTIDEIIVFLSRYFTLKIGDIIFAGINTDSGKIEIDQHFHGSINGVDILNFKTK